jgi:ubiquitin carboxyl-terminal hydrolase 16/45
VAVVVHLSASAASGHYVVYVRRLEGAARQQAGIGRRPRERWFRMSDHSAREAELGEVLGCEATLLLYERCA